MQAMIFAAGLGTRLRPLTDTKPKALIEINGKTLLERNIEKMVSYGIETIVVNIHHFPDMMTEFIKKIAKKYDCNIIISDERQELLDTGGGFLNARNLLCNNTEIKCRNSKFFSEKSKMFSENNLMKRHFISESLDDNLILLHNVDILSDIDFNDMPKKFAESSPLALLAVQKRDTQRYLIFNEENELCGWTNLKTNEKIITRKCKQENLYAFSGVHLVSNEIFEKITQKGVFSITDMYLKLSENNIIKPYIHNGLWIDTGKLSSIEKAEQMF